MKNYVVLNDGNKMPRFGLGVFLIEDGKVTINTVSFAIDNGYKLIDTAAVYKNEVGVGEGIKASNAKREDLFLTTKVWNSDHGYEETKKALNDSLERLGTDYVDLYLIHWPGMDKDKMTETWKAMIELKEQGKIKSIGVSNFEPVHIEHLVAATGVVPTVNQVECHPFMAQQELYDYCMAKNIYLEAWSPLMHGHMGDLPMLDELAKKYSKTPAQICLRFAYQRDIIIIPKTTKEHRLMENKDILDFELSDEDMELLLAQNKKHRFGPDPFEFTKGF